MKFCLIKKTYAFQKVNFIRPKSNINIIWCNGNLKSIIYFKIQKRKLLRDYGRKE